MAYTFTTDQSLNPLVKWVATTFYIGEDTRDGDGDDISHNGIIYTRLVTGTSATAPNLDTVNWLAYTSPSSKVAGNVSTSDATPAVAGQIITLTDDANHTIEVNVACKQDANVISGSWNFTLRVTMISGVVVIQGQSLDFFDGGAGLLGTSVEMVVNGGRIDIEVTGIVATTFRWKTLHEIILIVE